MMDPFTQERHAALLRLMEITGRLSTRQLDNLCGALDRRFPGPEADHPPLRLADHQKGGAA